MPLFRPIASRTGPFTYHQLPGRLGGHRLAVEVERGIERGLGGRDHDRKVGRPAAGQHRAGRDPLQRRLAHIGRDGAERNPAVAAAEHRLDPVRGRRDDRKAVGPAALEHLLDVVGAGRDRDRGRQLRVDRGLGRASGLEQRLGGLRDRELGAKERSRPAR
jgi:hypothetical protein